MAPRRPPPSSPLRFALLSHCLALGLCAAWPTRAQAEENAPSAAQPTAAKPKAGPEPSVQGSTTDRERQALESAARRRDEAERAGKSGLARRLSALSARWAKVIEALETAAKLEAEAARVEDDRIRVQEETDRLITLVEQTEARRARALARLQALGLEPAGASADPSPPKPPLPAPAASKPEGGLQ